ncbi:hypothetical protein [Pollutibacter soli]|uniref:hypothetical protein n=1 Tax=Pollutibacter soli TaxID=3034157 RepID=UPI0030140693
MKTKIAFALMLALSLSLSAVYAQKPGYRENAYERERYGYNQGKYNRHDSRNDSYQKRRLQKKIRRAKCNDGYISNAERKRIERDWRAMNRNIYKQKRNDWDRR